MSEIKFLYSTREKYPTFRVDLTELFSNGLVKEGYCIDWHMQAMDEHKFEHVVTSESETVYVGAYSSKKSFLTKIKNNLLGFYHDILIFKRVKENNYDFIQVRDKVFAGCIAALAAKKAGIPFYYWMSFPYPEADLFRAKDQEVHQPSYMRVFYWLRGKVSHFFLYRFVLKRAEFIFVQSDKMLLDVSLHGISKEKIMPVPMGINFDAIKSFENKSEPLVGLEDKEVLIYLGTMVRVRKIDFLLDMLKIILQTRPGVVLLLVGDAPKKDMDLLKERAKQLNLNDHVIFTGFVPMSIGWEYILQSDVCLSPLRPSPILDLGTPTKVIEYMALGKPVVANKHPDQSVVLNASKAGLAVDYDPNAFSDACIQILESSELAIEMGVNGVEYVKKYRTYNILSQKLTNKYDSLMEMNSEKLCG